MKKIKGIQPTDVVFLHADDRATIRQGYSRLELREGLLLHILYFGRAVIPINFLLANPQFERLFSHKGQLSDQSDMFQLIRSGYVVPLMFDDDFLRAHPEGDIIGYAGFSLEKGILLPCSPDQWLGRAELLNQFDFVQMHGLRAAYRETLLAFLHHKGIQRYYLPALTKQRHDFLESLSNSTSDLEHPTRSDTYKATKNAPSMRLREGLKLISDAAYYAAFADASGANPAIPRLARPALLPHYSSGPSPFLFTPENEAIEVFDKPIPNLRHLGIAKIINDLADTPSRERWLCALSNHMAESDHVDPMAEDLATPFGQFSHVIFEYLSSTGPKQRESVLEKERRFFRQMRVLQLGSDLILVLGAGLTTFQIVQGVLRGDPNLTSLVTLVLSTGAKLGIRRASKYAESRRPTYGSTIPQGAAFTLKGTRRG
jgi:hypothetical protein